MLKRSLNSTAKSCILFNCNITFEINVKILMLMLIKIIHFLHYNIPIIENRDVYS